MKPLPLVLSLLSLFASLPAFAQVDALQRDFITPPDSAKPWAYWWWLNGHVSREGITRDLEAMKRQGINGVLLFNAGGGDSPAGLKFFSPEWRAMYRHALSEAARLGMEVSVNLCDGWDAGGPWITPEAANKRLVYSETQAEGPGRFAAPLPQPPTLDGFYREVAVIAVREPAKSPIAPLRITANSERGGYCDEKNWPCEDVADRDPETVWRPGTSADGEAWVQLEYAQPLRAAELCVAAPPGDRPLRCRLLASDDGKKFEPVAEFTWKGEPQKRVPFPERTARFFRLAIRTAGSEGSLSGASWIWYPEGEPAQSAPPGIVSFRKRVAIPEGRTIRKAVFSGTADNVLAVHVNGQAVGKDAEGLDDFRRVKAIDVTAQLRAGDNVLAVAATNTTSEPTPAGMIGALEVQFAEGEPMSVTTDASWKAFRGDSAQGWTGLDFDDRAWPAAKRLAAYGGGPWGRPAAQADLALGEVWLLRPGDEPHLRPGIRWWSFKSANRSFWDWPKQGPAVLQQEYDGPDACDVRSGEVVDLTGRLGKDGRLQWDVPAGRWTILRFGYTLQGQRTRCGSTVGGYEADMLDAAGIECHFKNLAVPLLDEAGPAVGRTLKYLHIDSYELGADIQGRQPTWSAEFRKEFKARRGYDLLPMLPALARRVVDGRERTNRFLWDIRATIGDLMAERFFQRFAELAHARGVGMHCETGYGTYPHPHFDGLRCAAAGDVAMGEFWHGTDIMSQFDPFCNVIRSVASAAHIYDRRIVQAEAFTSWNHFLEYPYALKAVGDEAFCDGLNRMVFHQYTHQPQSDVIPGWQYGAGTHIDRHLTWWPMSHAWFAYLARCQHLLQSGRFHADVAYYYGEGATKYVPGRSHIRPALPEGYDFDCVNTTALLYFLKVKDGRLVLPNGAGYRLLVLPEERTMSWDVLIRVWDLLGAGATVYGRRPLRAPGLNEYPQCDEAVRVVRDDIWGSLDRDSGDLRVGGGRVIWGKSLKEVLSSLDLPPDVEFRKASQGAKLNFIHRTSGPAELYFVANGAERSEEIDCAFRISGKQPELWDPVTGAIRDLPQFRQENGRTVVPLQLAPMQSYFVVFHRPAAAPRGGSNFPQIKAVGELTGPWEVRFDPKWGGPEKTEFAKLDDWTARPEDAIRHYSGTATYRKTLDLAKLAPDGRVPPGRTWLDLGTVKNLARVRLNGKDLGVVWTAPWRVETTGVLKSGSNQLEIDVVNLWPNRLIGDASLPPEKRLTKTNVHFAPGAPLLPSGLLGPVRLVTSEE
jgi:hypothetical protein